MFKEAPEGREKQFSSNLRRSPMKVKEVMTKEVMCCTPSDTAQTAATIMRTHNVGAVLVVSDMATRTVEGIVTDRDLCCTVVVDGMASDYIRVQQLMTPSPITCGPNDTLNHCEEL